MSKVATLMDSQIFGNFSNDELHLISELSTEHEFQAAELIIREGEAAQSLFIIQSGTVEVLKHTQGDASSCISLLTAGDVFGELAFIEKSPVTAHVVARENLKILEIPYKSLERLAQANPIIGMKLYQTLSISVCKKVKSTTANLMKQILSSRLVELGQMAMAISHEINNPLAVLELKLDVLTDQISQLNVPPSQLLGHVNEARLGVKRITKIIKGLQIVGRDSQNDPAANIDLKELINETVEFCKQRFKSNNVQFDIGEIPDKTMIECRNVQIAQVLINLLNNAYDAVGNTSEKWVRLHIEDLGHGVEIAITDSGPAIPANIRANLFQPFFTTLPLRLSVMALD